jgi:signal transduction histidine kinase
MSTIQEPSPQSTAQLPPSARPALARPAARPYNSLARTFFGAYALIAVLIIGSIWALEVRDRQRELERQQTELSSLARALEEHVTRTIGHVDTSLQFLARLLANDTHIRPEALATLSIYARNWLQAAPEAGALAISDLGGEPLLLVQQNWLHMALSPPKSAAGKIEDTLAIAAPVKWRKLQSEEWFIPVTRPILGLGGQRIGTVSGWISSRYFDEFYHDIQFAPGDSISLLAGDGRSLLHFPPRDTESGAMQAPPALLDAAGATTQAFSGEQSSDSQHSVVAWRRLQNYPLLVGIARTRDVALRNYFEMRSRLVVAGALLLGLIALSTWAIFRDARQRERDRAELAAINASLEERVRQRTAELEQSNRELVGFSYSVSHDLRTPLRAINGFAHALREDCAEQLDATAHEHLSRITRASVRMGELIDELLNLANVSRRPLNIKPLQLSQMAQEIFTELRITEPERQVDISVQPGMHAEGDEALLRNALYNLLHNAWKFTRGQPITRISIHAEPLAEGMQYTVSDNGLGFDLAHTKRLFQPFQQLHAEQGFGGLGIGLASVRRIIERHGGQIHAESSPGEGARFIFTLPQQLAVVRRRREAASTQT